MYQFFFSGQSWLLPAVNQPFYFVKYLNNFFLLLRLRSIGQHRCVTHLYVIPMWNFSCVITPPAGVKTQCIASLQHHLQHKFLFKKGLLK